MPTPGNVLTVWKEPLLVIIHVAKVGWQRMHNSIAMAVIFITVILTLLAMFGLAPWTSRASTVDVWPF